VRISTESRRLESRRLGFGFEDIESLVGISHPSGDSFMVR
jgi:hypothetical protein